MIDVHAKDVVEQDAFALVGGQAPFAFAGLVDARGFTAGPFSRVVCQVGVPVPVQQKLISPDQKRTRAAGRVQDSDIADPALGAGLFAFHQPADGVFNDIVHDVGGGVVNPAGLAHLRLVLDFGLVAGGQADDLAQKFFIDLAEDIGREHGKLVGAVRVVEIFKNIL